MFRFSLRIIARSISRRLGRSLIAFTGVAVAIGALVVLEAIMEGVSDAMVRNSVALHQGHVQATWQGAPVALDPVAVGARGLLARRRFEGLLTVGARQAGVAAFGIDPQRESKETVIGSRLVAGTYLSAPGDILLGRKLADDVGANVGDKVSFVTGGTNAHAYVVGGIYRTGVALLDERMVFVRDEDAVGDARELAAFLDAGVDSRAVAGRMRASLPADADVVVWQDSIPELVQLIALNHVSMHIVLALTLVVLAFGVSNTVFISISERTREFGILKAVGMTPLQIEWLVLGEVLAWMTAAGGVGMVLGMGVVHGWASVGLDLTRWTSENPHFVASGIIYPRLTLPAALLPLAVAFVCGLISALLPARHAGRLRVTEALRQL